ncbi:MAG: thioredoxin family protein [Candidatus Bathyarchaeota archaeon]|nr:thioredoxin family protein [Candidatus Bathyarchaeota archaeon]
MKNMITIDIIGVKPPCPRCKRTEENAQKVAERLAQKGVKITVTKLDATAKETTEKYGVVATPAIAIDRVLKIMGKELGARVIERLILKEL